MERRKAPVEIEAFDALTIPGRPVTLEAKVIAHRLFGIRTHARGARLEFRVDGEAIGSAVTAEEGIATFVWSPPDRVADHAIRVDLVDERREAVPATLRVFVRDPKRPSLVVDLDGTVCASNGIDVLFRPPSAILAADGAAEALRSLAARFDVVYLTGRDEGMCRRTLDWLELREFPSGPVLFRDLGLFTLSAKSHKIRILRELRRDFTLAAGVGDRHEDAEAYLDVGMKAILVGNEDDVPKGAIRVPTWADVANLLRP
jgi:phosphatidate phosphatase APP1